MSGSAFTHDTGPITTDCPGCQAEGCMFHPEPDERAARLASAEQPCTMCGRDRIDRVEGVCRECRNSWSHA